MSDGQEKVKIGLFADDLIGYMEKHKNEIGNDFEKYFSLEAQVNIPKSKALIYKKEKIIEEVICN